MRNTILCLLTLCFALQQAKAQRSLITLDVPEMDTLVLSPYSTIDTNGGYEISGLVKSRNYDNVYWAINDSGDPARVVPFNRNGELIKYVGNPNSKGMFIGGAINSDWEDIAIDDQGFLYISDFGNNCNCRKDLVFYKIIENGPTMLRTQVFEKIFVRYPDQKVFPAPADNRNFDSEGVFWLNGKLYVFSKHRSDSYTKLYRLDKVRKGQVNTLKQIGYFDSKGMVTAADVSADGNRLAVLTYTGVWLFEAQKKGDFFNGKIWYRPIRATQVEAIAFDGPDTLIIVDEKGGLMYEVKQSDLKNIR